MDEFSKSSDILDQTDEDILTPTVSDEAIQAAGIEGGAQPTGFSFCWKVEGKC